jgi:hypothetical protein
MAKRMKKVPWDSCVNVLREIPDKIGGYHGCLSGVMVVA